MESTEMAPAENGVNVEALLSAREALEAAPEAAQFKWRAESTWINGTHSQSTISGFLVSGKSRAAARNSQLTQIIPSSSRPQTWRRLLLKSS